MQRLVERCLRDEALALMPLHLSQHAYQAEKFVETALLQLLVSVEKAGNSSGCFSRYSRGIP